MGGRKKSESLSKFKKILSKIIRPQEKSTYNINVIGGVRYLTKLCIRFIMQDEHKFKHHCHSLTPVCAKSLYTLFSHLLKLVTV